MKVFLTCNRCGNRAVIQRSGRSKRSHGHIKTLWCWRCKRVVQHTELHR